MHGHGWGDSVCVQLTIMGREEDVWSRHSFAVRTFLVWWLECSGPCRMSCQCLKKVQLEISIMIFS